MVAVAQLAEHQVVVLAVVGSSPIGHPIHKFDVVKSIKNIIKRLLRGRNKTSFFLPKKIINCIFELNSYNTYNLIKKIKSNQNFKE